MFGKKDKLKEEIKEKAGKYEFGYNMPDGMKKKIKDVADSMNDYVGEKVIEIEDD